MFDSRKKLPCKYYTRGFCWKPEADCPFGHFRNNNKYDDGDLRSRSRSESVDSRQYYRSNFRSRSRSRSKSRSRADSRSKSPKVRFQSTYFDWGESNLFNLREASRSETPDSKRSQLNSSIPSTSQVENTSSNESIESSSIPLNRMIIDNRWCINPKSGYRVNLRTITKKRPLINKNLNKDLNRELNKDLHKKSTRDSNKEPNKGPTKEPTRDSNKEPSTNEPTKRVQEDERMKKCSKNLSRNQLNRLKLKFEKEVDNFSLLGSVSKSISESFECWLWQKELKLYQFYLPDKNQRKLFTIFEKNRLPNDPPFDLVPTNFDLVSFNNSVIAKIKECSKLEFVEQQNTN